MSYDESLRRNALDLTTRGIGLQDTPVKLVEAAAIVERFLRTGQVEPHPFRVGELTQARVFAAAGLQNLSDLQAVLDAVEAALQLAEPDHVGPYQVNAATMGTAVVLADVSQERNRQVAKGWTPEHDDHHAGGELAIEAAWALLPCAVRRELPATGWIMRGTDRRAELVQAIAVAVAEVERLDRLPQPAVPAAPAGDDFRTHGDDSAVDDEAPLPIRDPVLRGEAPVPQPDGHTTHRTLTTADVPAIVREAVLTVDARQRRAAVPAEPFSRR